MIHYYIHPALATRKACGETLLIRYRDDLGYLPDITVLSEGGAYYWDMIIKGLPENEILDQAAKDTGYPVEDLRPEYDNFIQKLIGQNYISLQEHDE